MAAGEVSFADDSELMAEKVEDPKLIERFRLCLVNGLRESVAKSKVIFYGGEKEVCQVESKA